MGIIYCPELNPEDIAKNNGQGLIDLLLECNKYSDDISQLDSFTSRIQLEMRTKGMESNKSLVTIIYSRRWVLCTFCVHMIMGVLKLGQESDNQNATGEQIQPKSETEKQETKPTSKIVNQPDILSKIVSNSLTTLTEETKLPERNRNNPLEVKLKKCSNAACDKQESAALKFLVCGSCKKNGVATAYCSKECQKIHWKTHQLICGKKTNSSI